MKKDIVDIATKLNGKNVHVETKDGRSFTGHLNLAGEALILTRHEYLVHANEVSSIREV